MNWTTGVTTTAKKFALGIVLGLLGVLVSVVAYCWQLVLRLWYGKQDRIFCEKPCTESRFARCPARHGHRGAPIVTSIAW
jgi:hypothetical protein